MSNEYFGLYFYNDFTKIKKDENGKYMNYTSYNGINNYDINLIPFNNLICNNDYYFIIPKYNYNIAKQNYLQISIFNDETNIFNLSPSLSLYYTLFPRNKNKTETFYYCFNETKYALINYDGLLEIKEDGKIIYNNNSNIFEFKKDLEYYIYYRSDSPIYIHFYNESTFFKYNKEDFPMILYGKDNEYRFEINISDYKVGEYIIFKTYGITNWYIKYQYKNDSKIINLEEYFSLNYIPIKKTKNDSSLILYIKYTNLFNLFSILNIVKDDVLEIDSDYNSTIIGPKFLLLDYFKFNNLKSFAIESNKSFIFYEQQIDYRITVTDQFYNNLYIFKLNDEDSLFYKRGFIHLNSTDTYQIVIKRFNFSIIQNKRTSKIGHEYLSLCQGEEPKTELYYYKSRIILNELFTPVFGNFDSFNIKESNIKTLSDFDFRKINETSVFINENGYLKIFCKEPTLIKHSYLDKYYTYNNLTSGKSYIFPIIDSNSTISLSDTLKGKTVSLKFSIIGGKNNYFVKININGTEHILSNKSLELDIEYNQQEMGPYFISLNKGDIEEEILIEVIVGLKEDFKDFQILDLNDVFGNFNLGGKRTAIIKVPKDYDDNFYNFSIIPNRFVYSWTNQIDYYFEICYDKIEFIPLNNLNENIYEYNKIISFFVNPYSYIPNNSEKSDEKFFYIFVYLNEFSDISLLIKRPKLFTDINFKKINTFPKLKGENKKYYYKIPLPNEDYDPLLIQTNYNSNISFSLSKENTIYFLYSINYNNFYNIPIDKKDILNKNIYFNYYGNSYSDGYINFIPKNDITYYQYAEFFSFNLTIKQKEKTNKLIINLKSYSYYIKRPIIYYFIINESKDDDIIFSALTEKRKFGKNKMMLKVEDNGENEDFQTEFEINKELIDYEPDHALNSMIIVPVDKETNFVFRNSKNNTIFKYENIKSSSSSALIIIIVIGILILIIVIGFLYYRKKKKEKRYNIENDIDANEKIISDN